MVERTAPRVGSAALIMAALLAWLWLLEIVDQFSGNRLDYFGIHAQELDGLPGILTAPFLHAGWEHLISNSMPFFVLGFLVLLGGLARWLASSLISIIASGLTAWLLTPGNTIIIGASGLDLRLADLPAGARLVVPAARTGGHRHPGPPGLRRTDLRGTSRHGRHQLAGPPRRCRRRRDRRLAAAPAAEQSPPGPLRLLVVG